MKKIFFVLEGNNGATYILNTKDTDALSLSLRFYKARTVKQRILKSSLKIYLNGLVWLCKTSIFCVLKNKNEIEHHLKKLVYKSTNFELDENSSILISPTRDKVIVHHHGHYFHKFAFGHSYTKVENEAKVYGLLDRSLYHFEVSKFLEYVDHENNVCSFKLASNRKTIKSKIDLTLALVELFAISRKEGALFSAYVEDLKKRYLQITVTRESTEKVFSELDVIHGDVRIPVGLVHRDFKPWNINDEHGLLFYDFEEAVTDGLLLEDLLNYHIDPIVRYLPSKDIAEHIYKKERVNEYKRYLKALEIGLDYQVLLYCYLIERIIFWKNAGEQKTSEKYSDLFEYIVMEHLEN